MGTTLAIGLFSGGLDSILAARLVARQGIEIVVFRFISPFFGWSSKGREEEDGAALTARLGFPVIVRSIWPGYMEIVLAPRHGRGKNMNPCLDCKIHMLKLAAEEMASRGAAFVFTGEVLGQRPMSQRRDTLSLLERESGLKERLLRPLSAKLLAPTLPEREGMLDRNALLDFAGRSRGPQMALAKELGIAGYPAPAGGCLLTDPIYAVKLRKLLSSEGEGAIAHVELLSVGRQFLLGPAARLVVGRRQAENEKLAHLAEPGDILMRTPDLPGPVGLLRGRAGEDEVLLAARITARYADHHGGSVRIVLLKGNLPSGELTVSPALPGELEPMRF